jgi:ATP-dependent helicase/nuclease subunit A
VIGGARLMDAAVRARIRDDLDATLIVEAAAGTGKTTALVSRIVALVRAGRATLRGLVAVTYTDKAAGEMKLRLRTEIERARAAGDGDGAERERLAQALAELELAHIGTIHALCGDLLRERPLEARVDPSFEIVAGDEQGRLYERAFDRWFQRVVADPPEGVRRILRRGDWEGPRALLRDAGWKLLELRGFEAPWRRDPLDRAAVLDAAVARLDDLLPLDAHIAEPEHGLAEAVATLVRWKQELDRRERLRGRDHDGLEAELRELTRQWRPWNLKGKQRAEPFGSYLSRSDALTLRDGIKAQLDQAVALCEADLAPRLREELRVLIDEYEALKLAAGKLDFVDLLLCARDLIRDAPAVRRDLQARFSHVLVDEFQDTDPLQAEILLLLAAGDPGESDWLRVRPAPGKLFLVGDPKQSIYRFRRADIALYEGIKDRLGAAGAEVVHLSANFRSVPALQAAVNGAFAEPMAARPGPARVQAQYAPLSPVRPAVAGQPSLIALPIPAPYKNDWGDLASKGDIERSSADAIAAFIEWLVQASGWKVSDPQGGLVPVEARHVCLLFRRLQSFGDDTTRPVTRALEARRIAHVLVGGRGYGEREEVEALRNALSAIEWPDDEFSVFATLRGPLFCLSDAQLLCWRQAHRSLHPFAPAVKESGDEDTGAALALLARLHRGRNRRPIADTILQLLEATRAHAGIAIWPTGEQALANVLRLVDLARRFEAGGASSFRGFVERLRDQAERHEAAEAPVLEDGSDGVRIMTVHKAKGLEFPVVVLADPTVAHVGKPSRHVDGERGLCLIPLAGCLPAELDERRTEVLERDHAESVRLTYVAATRARDLLVVPCVGDQRMAGWVDVLHPALYPPPETQRQPRPAAGCPAFGPDSLVVRPPRGPRDLGDAVAPGEHRPERGEHAVVWWDPTRLALDREDQAGIRQQKILEPDQGGQAADASIRAHAAWQARRAEILSRGVHPSLVAATVTDHTRGLETTRVPGAVEIARVPRAEFRRPHGRRFGTLVHAVLAEIALDARPDTVRATATVQGRYLGCPDDEVEAAAATVAAALRHPLLERAAVSAQCRREVAVALRLPDGAIVDGVVDLAFADEAGGPWTVVDFKTDLGGEANLPSYEEQVRLYAQAISSATSRPARPILLYV